MAGAMALGSLAGSSAAHAATTTTASTALDPGRRATFAALAETVLTGPSLRLDAAAAQPAAAEFATAYATWPAHDRRRADQVLDRLARLDARDRERALRPPGLERRETELAEQALSLVALVTAPSDDAAHQVVTL
jgi:hypothetical protein